LPQGQRDNFAAAWKQLPHDTRSQQLRELKVPDKLADKLAADEVPANLSPAEQELQWRAHAAHLLDDDVGPEAVQTYRQRVAGEPAETPYVGILATVVATRDHWVLHRTVSLLARWNPWLWRSEEPLPYLSALLAIAVVLILVRQLLLFANHYATALASIE